MKLLGIDYGRRRIGVARTDETGICVCGCKTIDLKKNRDPIPILLDIISNESPEALVFGLPLGPYDEETAMSKEIRAFVENFIEMTKIKLPVHFVDESFSSKQAKRQLLHRKKKQRRNKKNIDLLSACNILESFLREQQCGHQML